MYNGLEGKYVVKNNRKLAYGYTTGSCAAAAAKAAAAMLFTGQQITETELMTPKGILLHLQVKDIKLLAQSVLCAIQKDAGDDPDVTNGILIYASATYGSKEPGDYPIVILTGGQGVGVVTKQGLEQPVGSPAINRVPREMITKEVTEVCREHGYRGELVIEISVPEGEEKAKKTFNPRLGIEGGISILGTSGIVEPMSEAALLASIRLEMQMRKKNGEQYLFIAPGNYGIDYLSRNFPFDMEQAVKCSNFVGETMDMALELELKGILFVSHIGKFIKVAGGIMNTHSRNADARMELLAANALRAGADSTTLLAVLNAVTTEEGLAVLQRNQRLQPTMACILEKIEFYLNNRSYQRMEMAAILFSNEYGELGRTTLASSLIDKIIKQHKGEAE